MTGQCETCGAVIKINPAHKRRRFCSERCRKAQYDRECVDCGRRVDGTTPSRIKNNEPRCFPCSVTFKKANGHYNGPWPHEKIIERINEWNTEHGEPPAIADWSASHALNIGDVKRAERAMTMRARGDIPHALTVVKKFGSWNAAIEAAGLTPRAGHGGAGNQLRRRKRAA